MSGHRISVQARQAARADLLVADIGGTNARFALVAPGQAQIDVVSMCCEDFAGPLEAVRAFLAGCAVSADAVKQAAFAVAAAVDYDTIHLTNSPWTFERGTLERALGIDRLLVLNDFAALALALPGLGTGDYRPVGAVLPAVNQPMVAIGPGTGLGVAGLVPTKHGWIAVPGEGGHATLAASDDFEAEILRAARKEFPHVSAERLLSGIGLPVLLRAVCAVRGLAAPDLPADEISAQAVADRNPECRTTLELFFALLGSFAGNVALTFGARGGVFIGGGIVPRLPDFLAASRFRERFEGKGRFQPYLANIATVAITAPHLTLRGLLRALESDAAG